MVGLQYNFFFLLSYDIIVVEIAVTFAYIQSRYDYKEKKLPLYMPVRFLFALSVIRIQAVGAGAYLIECETSLRGTRPYALIYSGGRKKNIETFTISICFMQL